MQQIGGPLKRLLKQLGLTAAMEGWKAVELWSDVVGERVASKTAAIGCEKGELIVQVENAAWMNELDYLKRNYINALNDRLGGQVVRKIVFRQGTTPGALGPKGEVLHDTDR